MYIFVQLGFGSGYGSSFSLTADVGPVVPSTASDVQLTNGLIIEVSNSATLLTITPTLSDCPPMEFELPTPPPTTTTSSTTTIRPDCECYYLYHNYKDPVPITYNDCKGRLAGFTLPGLTPTQMCGSNFVPYDAEGVTIIQGGPCIPSGTLFECDGCSAECNTYYVENLDTEIQTFTYIDCNGQIATASVPAGDGEVSGEMNVCVCGDLDFGGEGFLTAYLVTEGECTLCKCYKVYNPTKDEIDYDYTDCDTNTVYSNGIAPGQIQYVCSLSNGFTADPRLVVTNTNNYCQILYPEIKGVGVPKTGIPDTPTIACAEPDHYCHNVVVTGTVTIEYVNAFGILNYVIATDTTLYLCAWEGSIVKYSGSGTIVITNTFDTCYDDKSCEECYCYTVYNTSDVNLNLNYAECKAGSMVQVIDAGDNFTYCGKSPYNPEESFIVLKGNTI